MEALHIPTVSYRALDRAIGTLSFFLQIQLPVFRRDFKDTWHILPVLYFSEMTIYQLDEVNEDKIAGKDAEIDRFRVTMDLLSHILRKTEVYDDKVRDILAIGMEYWDTERKLCAALNDQRPVPLSEAERTLRMKSFDLAHMRHILKMGLHIGESEFNQINTVLESFDYWAEVLDDYYDYEKDERNKSFNIARCLRLVFPQDRLEEQLIRYAYSALQSADALSQSLPVETRTHLQRHIDSFATPEKAAQLIAYPPQSILQSPDVDTEIYRAEPLSTPVFSFAHFLKAFRVIQSGSFEPAMCRERNQALLLSSLLSSNWDDLPPIAQHYGHLELEKALARKCENTKHNALWCNHAVVAP